MKITNLDTHAAFILFAIDADVYQSQQLESLLNLAGHGVEKCQGGYRHLDGTVALEDSYLVPVEARHVIAPFILKQESVLVLSELYYKPNLRRATLVFDENPGEDLGFFQTYTMSSYCTEETLVEEFGGFTKIGKNYWVASTDVFNEKVR